VFRTAEWPNVAFWDNAAKKRPAFDSECILGHGEPPFLFIVMIVSKGLRFGKTPEAVSLAFTEAEQIRLTCFASLPSDLEIEQRTLQSVEVSLHVFPHDIPTRFMVTAGLTPGHQRL